MGERDTGPMLFIGAPCHACRREEFLPLTCSECRHPFCAAHARPEAHACRAQERDFFVPLCPLCLEPPKGWVRGASPEATQRQLQAHWSAPSVTRGGCRMVLAEHGTCATRSGTPRCSAAACHTVLHVAIRCPHCQKQFCAQHRGPSQHACRAAQHARSTPEHNVLTTLGQLRDRVLPSAPTASPPATLQSPACPTVPGSPPAPAPDAPAASTSSRPTRATARRAAEERRSAIRAMRARHQRGLLSDAEQQVLAEKMAQEAAAAAAAPRSPSCPIT